MSDRAALRGEVAVSELRMGGKTGDNVIVIAMTRDDAGWLRDVPRGYIPEEPGRQFGKSGELSRKLPAGMDACFPPGGMTGPMARLTARPAGHGHGTKALALAALALLAACGGGGGSGGAPAPVVPPPPGGPAELETQRGGRLSNPNFDPGANWYANPRVDLPRDGTDGLDVERPPRGGAAVPGITFAPSLAHELEPVLRYRESADAEARLEFAANVVWAAANKAYLQWTRHLDYDSGPRALQVGGVRGGLTAAPAPSPAILPPMTR